MLLDFCDSVYVTAAVENDTPAEQHSTVIRVRDEAGQIQMDEAGTELAGIIDWLCLAWPSARAQVVADRIGVRLSGTESGEVAVELGKAAVPVDAIVGAVLDNMLAAGGEPVPTTATMVVPATLGGSAVERLGDLLEQRGVSTVYSVVDAVAALHASGLSLGDTQHALTVHVGRSETRVALVEGADTIVAAESLPHAGLDAADRLFADLAATSFLREHGIDVEDDPSLYGDLLAQVMDCRCTTPPGLDWSLTMAGAPLSLAGETIGDWGERLNGIITVACENLFSWRADPPIHLEGLVLTSEQALWPGLADSIERATGIAPVTPEPGPGVRLRGAL